MIPVEVVPPLIVCFRGLFHYFFFLKQGIGERGHDNAVRPLIQMAVRGTEFPVVDEQGDVEHR